MTKQQQELKEYIEELNIIINNTLSKGEKYKAELKLKVVFDVMLILDINLNF